MLKLDHIMYASPLLDPCVERIAALTGVKAAYGGAHPGNGTHNALLSLSANQYLELISPDPAQAQAAVATRPFASRNANGLRTWAVNAPDLSQVLAVAVESGLTGRSVTMSRTTPAGVTLEWDILFVGGHTFGELFPFFINWRDSPHPSTTTPSGCTLASFTVQTENRRTFERLLATFNIDGVTVVDGDAALKAELIGRQGKVTL